MRTWLRSRSGRPPFWRTPSSPVRDLTPVFFTTLKNKHSHPSPLSARCVCARASTRTAGTKVYTHTHTHTHTPALRPAPPRLLPPPNPHPPPHPPTRLLCSLSLSHTQTLLTARPSSARVAVCWAAGDCMSISEVVNSHGGHSTRVPNGHPQTNDRFHTLALAFHLFTLSFAAILLPSISELFTHSSTMLAGSLHVGMFPTTGNRFPFANAYGLVSISILVNSLTNTYAVLPGSRCTSDTSTVQASPRV